MLLENSIKDLYKTSQELLDEIQRFWEAPTKQKDINFLLLLTKSGSAFVERYLEILAAELQIEYDEIPEALENLNLEKLIKFVKQVNDSDKVDYILHPAIKSILGALDNLNAELRDFQVTLVSSFPYLLEAEELFDQSSST